MLKNILKIIAIFVLGVGGGIFADQILWPYFIERPLFYKYRLEQSPIYITEKNEITIQENVALKNAIEKVGKTVVAVETTTKTGKVLAGSGVIITSDGLLVTLAELAPQGQQFAFFIDGKKPAYQVLKRDLKKNLALLKLEEKNLPTIGLADFNKIKLGERIFLVGARRENNEMQTLVNEGIVKAHNSNLLQTNIFDSIEMKGSPLFNIEGELVGLSQVDSNGRVSAISIKDIKEFAGF